MLTRFSRRVFLAGAIGAAIAVPAHASERLPFDQRTFDATNAAGMPILVHVTADWCETCQAQKPIVAQLTSDPSLAGITIFNVDYDAQKDVLREFGVQMQSTMIVFRGGKEIDRAVGQTDPAVIEALLREIC